MKNVLIFILLSLFVGSCIHPQIKFRKAKLLDPMMDPAKTEGLHSSFKSEPWQQFEKGSANAGQASGGSCPTCGS